MMPISASAGGGGPSDAIGKSAFDSSGWNVNFGQGTIASTRADAGSMGQYMPYALAAVGLLIAWKLSRKKKG